MSIPFLSVSWRVCGPTRTFYMQSLSILISRSSQLNDVFPLQLKSLWMIPKNSSHPFSSRVWSYVHFFATYTYTVDPTEVSNNFFMHILKAECQCDCLSVLFLKSANVLRHVCWYFSAHQTFTSFTSWCADAGHIRAQRKQHSSFVCEYNESNIMLLELFLSKLDGKIW